MKDSGKGEPLSPNQRNTATDAASAQLLKRHTRDVRTLIEKRRNERAKAVEKLRLDGAAVSKIDEANKRFNGRDADAVGREQGKVVAMLAGVTVDETVIVVDEVSE